MGLINIQRNNTESNPANNSQSPYTSAPTVTVDWKVLLVVFFSLFAFWLTSLWLIDNQCNEFSVAICYPYYVAFYVPLFSMSLFLGAIAIGLVVEQWNKAKKSRLANMLYEHYDVKDAGRVMEYSARVAEQLARSEYLRGLDNLTYSSSGNSTGNSTQDKPQQTNAPIMVGIEDIFQK